MAPRRVYAVAKRLCRNGQDHALAGSNAIITTKTLAHAVFAAVGLIALPGAASLPARAQSASAPAAYVTAADVAAQIEKMRSSLKPGQTFAYQPILRADDASAAIEYWLKPGKPAVHPNQAEYVVVLAGGGTMVSGGTMTEAVTTNPSLIEGTRIVGGSTRQVRTGDVFMVAAGTPHWFGITGQRLVLLGTKIPQHR